MAAVKNIGLGLEFASEDLRRERGIVIDAVNKNRKALQFSSEDLRRDRKIGMATLKQDGCAL